MKDHCPNFSEICPLAFYAQTSLFVFQLSPVCKLLVTELYAVFTSTTIHNHNAKHDINGQK